MSSKAPKEEVFKAVLNAAIELDIQMGHLKWNYTTLASKSKISRTLIYYYFGKSKINILKEACHLFGHELAGRNQERTKMWESNNITAGLMKTRQLFKEYPFLIPYYFLNRANGNEIGELIRSYESEGQKKRKEFFPHLSDSEIRIMYATHLGLTIFADLDEDDLKLADKVITKSISGN